MCTHDICFENENNKKKRKSKKKKKNTNYKNLAVVALYSILLLPFIIVCVYCMHYLLIIFIYSDV